MSPIISDPLIISPVTMTSIIPIGPVVQVFQVVMITPSPETLSPW